MKVVFSLLLFVFSLSADLFSIDPALQQAIEKIASVPGATTLIEKATEAGPIEVRYCDQPDHDFEALWDAAARKIEINPPPSQCAKRNFFLDSV